MYLKYGKNDVMSFMPDVLILLDLCDIAYKSSAKSYVQ